jgi:hypothetical protein
MQSELKRQQLQTEAHTLSKLTRNRKERHTLSLQANSQQKG